MPRKKASKSKVFVIDTSVILYDHECIMNFEDNDIAIPISVLEELDSFKKGNDTLNYNAREFSRTMDKISASQTLHDWIKLKGAKHGKIKVEMNEENIPDARAIFGDRKADNRILNVANKLKTEFPDRQVTLVSKDINLRIKAKSLDIKAEDYETGKIRDVDHLYKGKTVLEGISSPLIAQIYEQGHCKPSDLGIKRPVPNEYFIIKNGSSSALAFYNPFSKLIERIEKQGAYGITPRNAEQVFAMHALLNQDNKLITLQGVAGTGKTLLALATAVENRKSVKQIFLSRPVVPLSNKDLGFLPGDINSKISPYMEPLYDNLKLIKNQFPESSKENQLISEMMLNEKIVITPLAYIRGRSLSNVTFIIDEAQNLTPHEVKTIITRAGENTRIIFTGDIFQIDTPYLDTQSNGLSYLIDKIHGHPISAHITLEKGERSELANLANSLL